MSISIHTSFWIVSALFGYFFSNSFLYAGLFVFVAFFSVLVHELGHAFMAQVYGLKPRVELYALGGVTTVQMTKMSLLQEFGFVMMGPLFGALLAGFFGALSIYWEHPPYIAGLLVTLFYNLNVIWTVLNLLPIHPLDGGQIMRIFFQWTAGESGLRFSYLLSALFAVLFGGILLVYWRGFEIMGALFMMFAFDSFRAFTHSKGQITDEDTEKLTTVLGSADLSWMKGDQEQAVELLKKELERLPANSQAYEEVLVLYCRYLAFMQQYDQIFATLMPQQKKLAYPLRRVLQAAAFQTGKYAEALQVGSKLFVETRDAEVASLNAQAAMKLGRLDEAANWQKSAKA